MNFTQEHLMIAGYGIAELEKTLYSAVLADVLDELGYRNQTFGPGIRPIDPRLKLSGRAFTAAATKVNTVPSEPYKLLLEALDTISLGEIFVTQTDAPLEAAFWGELTSTACRMRGGRGAIVDGLNRDTGRILEMQFPLCSRGQVPTDSKGRVDLHNYQLPIEIDGVRVNPGDYIFADIDGTVVVPRTVETETIKKAYEKVDGENLVRNALLNGMTCTEAYKAYGVF